VFFSSQHILTTILFTPLVGALALWFIPQGREDLQRKLANAFGLLGFVVSLPLLGKFKSDSAEPFQFIVDANWIPSLGVHFRLGVDGLSVVMVLLTTLLGAVAIASSWNAAQQRDKKFYILLLLLQTTVLGVFISLDLMLFYVFWELLLVPMYFLIVAEGTEGQASAAIEFFLYSLAGSVLMLLAILAIYLHRGTFDLREILLHPFAAQDGPAGSWLFLGFVLAFAVRVPMFPFHRWLPQAMAEAPAAASLLLGGVVVKTGAYGLLRFALPLFPDAMWKFRPLLVGLSLIAIVYGALICITQKNLPRMLAYSSISQMGLCTLGIFALTPLGLYGSVILQVSHGLTTGALLVVAGILHERRRTGPTPELISEFGGLSKSMPKLAAIYAAATLASLGLPLFSGFIGELTILRGAYEVRWYWAAWSAIGVILLAGSLLWFYQRIIFRGSPNPANVPASGPESAPTNVELQDLNRHEWIPLLSLILLSLWIGIFPAPLFHILKRPVENIVTAVHYELRRYVVPARTVAPDSVSPAGEVK
jgi:NADH-quinone oxidoreductase subunit M